MQENTQWRPSERAPLQPYRKSALHPTAYFRVMQNIMQGNNMSLKPHEACVIMSGGSQDAVAAAIALKFKHVPWPPGCVFLGIDVFFSTCVFVFMGPHDFAYTLLKSGGMVLLLVTDKEHSLHHLPS